MYCFTNAFQNVQNSLNAINNRLSTLTASIIPGNNLPAYLQNFTFNSGGVLNTPFFLIVGGLPTRIKLARTWNLVTASILTSTSSPPIFIYDFSGVVSIYDVSVEGTLAGTLNVGGQVYDASSYFGTPIYANKKLTLPMKMLPAGAKTEDYFYYNLYIEDFAQQKTA